MDISTTNNRDPQNREVARRYRHPFRIAVTARVAGRSSYCSERQTHPVAKRRAASRRCNFNSSNTCEPLSSVLNQTCDIGCCCELRSVQRHFHKKHVMTVKTRIHTAQCDEGAYEQRRTDKQHNRQG